MLITLFCVRPRRFNIGNDAILLGVRHLLRAAFDEPINIVQVPAAENDGHAGLSGLLPQSIHQMNLYGHGVLVGGGNLYENSGLDVDVHALAALRLPLMLFSLSHGRIYNHRHELVPRTDAMPAPVVVALNGQAALSVVRDDATLGHLRALGITKAVLGGCPSLLLGQLPLPASSGPEVSAGTLLSVRHPQLMSIPLRSEARMHGTVLRLVEMLEADGFGPVRLLCHDTRDLMFASSLGDVEYIVPDDVYSYLELLRRARLVVSFRLHAFVPCLSFGTPAINISYDERSLSLVRTLGFESWDIDFVRSADVVADVRDRCHRLSEFASQRRSAKPLWQHLEATMTSAMSSFASLVTAYASEGPSG
ncbi:MAG: polysaccharide pyruvyl transferase family protein [Acidobacteriota bacterium]